jgi:hypothetical protein
VSTLLRRVHMYAGLFLAPWVLMYALSTIAMNHRAHLGTKPPEFSKEYEREYRAAFSHDATPRQMGEQVLRDLGLEGAFAVNRPAPDGTLVINRQDLLRPRRVTYTPSANRVLVEKAEARPAQILERMHRRRGYAQPYLRDRVWGAIVDGFVVLSLIWAFTGVWLWWEMKVTRRMGFACLAGGCAVFAFFLASI